MYVGRHKVTNFPIFVTNRRVTNFYYWQLSCHEFSILAIVALRIFGITNCLIGNCRNYGSSCYEFKIGNRRIPNCRRSHINTFLETYLFGGTCPTGIYLYKLKFTHIWVMFDLQCKNWQCCSVATATVLCSSFAQKIDTYM